MALPAPSPTSTAVVTGASSGIGVDLARELVRRGHGVTLVARRADLLHALAEELSGPVRVEVVSADLADPDARAALLDTVAERGLTVDVLVNNAGLGTIGPVAESTVEAELRMVRVNVEAVTDLCTRALAQMVPRRRGAVLNVGSTAAFMPMPGQSGYAATKAFVQSYSEALAQEVRSSGVTVTVLCPGPVRTGFVAAAGIDEQRFEKAVPELLYETSAAVARAGIDGLDRGRRVVVPGRANAVLRHVEQHLPRRLTVPLLASQHPALRGR